MAHFPTRWKTGIVRLCDDQYGMRFGRRDVDCGCALLVLRPRRTIIIELEMVDDVSYWF